MIQFLGTERLPVCEVNTRLFLTITLNDRYYLPMAKIIFYSFCENTWLTSKRSLLVLFVFHFILICESSFSESSRCTYRNEAGAVRSADRLEMIPKRYLATANCNQDKKSGDSAPASDYLAKPEEIDLDGSVQKTSIPTPLGRIEVRWQRDIVALFGRAPNKALMDAASATSKVISKAGFGTRLQGLNLQWQVVFLDENLPQTQIPTYLIKNCHPAWMTPPANIYVVTQRVVAGCGRGSQPVEKRAADAELAEILIHEMGHVVEYALLGQNTRQNRVRSEGFATWFEAYASDLSSAISRGTVQAKTLAAAKSAIHMSPDKFVFQGTGEDYARASMYFSAIVEKCGVNGLLKVYDTMKSQNLDFFPAIEKTLYWNQKRLDQEVLNLVSAN